MLKAFVLVIVLALAGGCAGPGGQAPREAPASARPGKSVTGDEATLSTIWPMELRIGQYVERKRYAQAERVARDAVNVAEAGLGPGHPLVAMELRTLGWLCLKQKKFPEAELHFKRALELSEGQLKGPWSEWWAAEPLRRAAIHRGLGEVYLAQQRYGEAEPLLKNAIAISEAAGVTARDERNSLAEVYRNTGREAEARALIEPAAPGAEQKPLEVQARPLVPGEAEVITIRAMSVRLPAAPNWTTREVPMADGGRVIEFERDLPRGNRLQIHVVDYYGPLGAALYQAQMAGRSDQERLAAWIDDVWEKALVGPSLASKKWRHSEWADVVRAPQSRFGAACRELRVVREESESDGDLFLWQDWMLLCIDPVTHVPIELDYAERYPASTGAPSRTFADDAAAFFDGVEFRRDGK